MHDQVYCLVSDILHTHMYTMSRREPNRKIRLNVNLPVPATSSAESSLHTPNTPGAHAGAAQTEVLGGPGRFLPGDWTRYAGAWHNYRRHTAFGACCCGVCWQVLLGVGRG